MLLRLLCLLNVWSTVCDIQRREGPLHTRQTGWILISVFVKHQYESIPCVCFYVCLFTKICNNFCANFVHFLLFFIQLFNDLMVCQSPMIWQTFQSDLVLVLFHHAFSCVFASSPHLQILEAKLRPTIAQTIQTSRVWAEEQRVVFSYACCSGAYYLAGFLCLFAGPR